MYVDYPIEYVWTWFGSHNCVRKFILSSPSFLVVTPRLESVAYRRFILTGNIRRNLKLTTYIHAVPSQKMPGGVPLVQINQLPYILYRIVETSWPARFPGSKYRRLYRQWLVLCIHVVTLCTAGFVHLKNINTASQRMFCFLVILIIKRKYFPMQQ